MLRKKTLVCLAAFLAVLLTTGCSTTGGRVESGFLGDSSVYSALKLHPDYSDIKVYRTSSKPLANYDRFILPPVKIYLSEQGLNRNVTKEELAELGQFFWNKVYDALSDRYPITHVPGRNVAILRLAITDADPNLALMNIHPGTLIMGGGLGGASVEAELIDSVSGKRVSAALASSKGKRYEYASGLTKWGHTEGVLKDWAELIRKRVDEDPGVN